MTLRLNNQQNNSANIDYADQVGGADSTITIPQGNGTVALEGAAGGLGGNISRATIFRLSADFDNNDAVITGWETPDQAGESSGVGGAVTEATGVFTFPVTGIWLVLFNGFVDVGAGDPAAIVVTQLTTDGGTNFTDRAQCNAGTSGSTSSISSHAVFDITDTGQRQVRFRTTSFTDGSTIRGRTDSNQTTALFLRLGDT